MYVWFAACRARSSHRTVYRRAAGVWLELATVLIGLAGAVFDVARAIFRSWWITFITATYIRQAVWTAPAVGRLDECHVVTKTLWTRENV